MTSASKPAPGAGARGAPSPQRGSRAPVMTAATMSALVSIVLVAAVLRPALTSFGPVVERIDAELGIGSTALGVLGSLPIVCFAVVSAGAQVPARRFGIDRVVLVALVVLAVGLAVRFLPGQAPLWIGTALVGIGIAVGNVLLPSAVKLWFPSRVSLASGVYTSVLVAFAALGSGLSVPIAEAAGGNWRLALGASLPLVLVGVVWWAVRIARSSAAAAAAATAATAQGHPVTNPAPTSTPPREARLWKSPTAWFVTAFMGLQSFHFYVTVTWLPSIERVAGVSDAASGWHLSLSQVVGMLVGILCTALMGRRQDQRVVGMLTAVPVIAGCIGLWLAPGAVPALWAALLGAGQGSSLLVAMALIALRTATPAWTTRLSSMAQSIGYGLAAVGPFLAGALNDLTGSWLPVIALIGGAAALQGISGYGAGRDVTIGASPATAKPRVGAGDTPGTLERGGAATAGGAADDAFATGDAGGAARDGRTSRRTEKGQP
ncbi:CynX/NimT family MFS transporter [Pseudoclavibacter endophyticus]|nr:MFS transporter [Pseudoclavibacter endophyticus]